MLTRSTAIATSAFLGLVLGFSQMASAEDEAGSGFHDAMVEFLTIQDAAATIEDQISYAIAQQTLSGLAAAGIEITQPMQDIIVDVARTSLGARFNDVHYLAELYTPIYSEHYSEIELRELSRFWQSPIGKKTLAVMPKLTEGSALVLQEASTKFTPEFQTAIDKRFKEAGIVLAPQD